MFAGKGASEGVFNAPGVVPLSTAKWAALRQAGRSRRIQPDPCPGPAGFKTSFCQRKGILMKEMECQETWR
jgi:hypothetical protein